MPCRWVYDFPSLNIVVLCILHSRSIRGTFSLRKGKRRNEPQPWLLCRMRRNCPFITISVRTKSKRATCVEATGLSRHILRFHSSQQSNEVPNSDPSVSASDLIHFRPTTTAVETSTAFSNSEQSSVLLPQDETAEKLRATEQRWRQNVAAAWSDVPRIPVYEEGVELRREPRFDRQALCTHRIYQPDEVRALTESELHEKLESKGKELKKLEKKALSSSLDPGAESKAKIEGADRMSLNRFVNVTPISKTKMEAELAELKSKRSFSIINDFGQIRSVVVDINGPRIADQRVRMKVDDESTSKQQQVPAAAGSTLTQVPEATPQKKCVHFPDEDEEPSAPATPTGSGTPEVAASSAVDPTPTIAGDTASLDRHFRSTSTANAIRKKLIRYDSDDFEDNETFHEQRKKAREAREALRRRDVADSSPADTPLPYAAEQKVAKFIMKSHEEHPVNRQIQCEKVIIARIRQPTGELITFPDAEQHHTTLSEAIKLAQSLGLDVIEWSIILGEKGERRALVNIDDASAFANSYAEAFVPQEAPVMEVQACFEVPFRGGTHPHHIRVKCRLTAEYLAHKHPIRISLRDFGTAREGFPVLEDILKTIRVESSRLKAFHTASRINATYDEIFCYLHPTTSRAQQTGIVHPSQEELHEAMERRLFEEQQEIHVENKGDLGRKGWPQYQAMIQNGTAWTFGDSGPSLRNQRRIKIRLGWLPRSNNQIYRRRGDVELQGPHFYVKGYPTSMEKHLYPRISNVEQATTGAAVLGKRHAMTIADMNDENELPSEPSMLSRMWYRVQGEALEIGDMKTELGLKPNAKTRVPRWASQSATMGQRDNPGLDNPNTSPQYG
jgi:hypothetical protein